jgi:hypothetical protein
MARKAFNTTIEEDLQNKFKAECALDGINMNDVLELFMKGFISGEFKVEIKVEMTQNKKDWIFDRDEIINNLSDGKPVTKDEWEHLLDLKYRKKLTLEEAEYVRNFENVFVVEKGKVVEIERHTLKG